MVVLSLYQSTCMALSQVTHWPRDRYGVFYDGDSYIILNTYKKDPSSEVLSSYVTVYLCSMARNGLLVLELTAIL